jgi:hypothetical protein
MMLGAITGMVMRASCTKAVQGGNASPDIGRGKRQPQSTSIERLFALSLALNPLRSAQTSSRNY